MARAPRIDQPGLRACVRIIYEMSVEILVEGTEHGQPGLFDNKVLPGSPSLGECVQVAGSN